MLRKRELAEPEGRQTWSATRSLDIPVGIEAIGVLSAVLPSGLAARPLKTSLTHPSPETTAMTLINISIQHHSELRTECSLVLQLNLFYNLLGVISMCRLCEDAMSDLGRTRALGLPLMSTVQPAASNIGIMLVLTAALALPLPATGLTMSRICLWGFAPARRRE